MSKGTSTFTGVVTILGILQLFVAGLVGAYPSEEKYINLKRQFPDERTNLTVSTPRPAKITDRPRPSPIPNFCLDPSHATDVLTVVLPT